MDQLALARAVFPQFQASGRAPEKRVSLPERAWRRVAHRRHQCLGARHIGDPRLEFDIRRHPRSPLRVETADVVESVARLPVHPLAGPPRVPRRAGGPEYTSAAPARETHSRQPPRPQPEDAMRHDLSRRRFLEAATALGGLGVSGMLPRRRAATKNGRLAIAAIGMGDQMMNYLVKELEKVDQDIVAVCDVDRGRLAAAAANHDRLSKARAYTDYRELLDKETDVDAIVIGTPDHWHVPIAIAALDAGRHVYCEKPLAHSVAECRAPSRRRGAGRTWPRRPATKAAPRRAFAGAWR